MDRQIRTITIGILFHSDISHIQDLDRFCKKISLTRLNTSRQAQWGLHANLFRYLKLTYRVIRLMGMTYDQHLLILTGAEGLLLARGISIWRAIVPF